MLIVVAKTGNIGASTVLELLFDERAERKDIDVRVVSSGAKMGIAEAEYVAKRVMDLEPDLILYTTPNASAPGPKKVIETLAGRNLVLISDAPAAKSKDYFEEFGIGYILVKGDPMIGARREFLDPTEMAFFNADILKVLAGTGVLRLIQGELSKTVEEIKKGGSYLPKVVVTAKRAVSKAGFTNPYARSKALAAYRMAEAVGELNVRGCFMEKEAEDYILTVSSAHELLRTAAALVDEAREIEKHGDTLYRNPNSPDGVILEKNRILEKPY